jgi:hypothetical protein
MPAHPTLRVRTPPPDEDAILLEKPLIISLLWRIFAACFKRC